MSEEESESKFGVALAVGCGILLLLGGGCAAVVFLGVRAVDDTQMQMEEAMKEAEAAAAHAEAEGRAAEEAAAEEELIEEELESEDPAGD